MRVYSTDSIFPWHFQHRRVKQTSGPHTSGCWLYMVVFCTFLWKVHFLAPYCSIMFSLVIWLDSNCNTPVCLSPSTRRHSAIVTLFVLSLYIAHSNESGPWPKGYSYKKTYCFINVQWSPTSCVIDPEYGRSGFGAHCRVRDILRSAFPSPRWLTKQNDFRSGLTPFFYLYIFFHLSQ